MPNIGFEIKRKCKVCGAVFVAKTLNSHYCSPKCGKVAWKRKKDAKTKDAKLETIAHHCIPIAFSRMAAVLPSAHSFIWRNKLAYLSMPTVSPFSQISKMVKR